MTILHTFCDECFQAVDAPIEQFFGPQRFRGVDVDVMFEWPVCPNCGNVIALASMGEKNHARLHDGYRKRLGIPSGAEIRETRRSLGLTQRQLANLLGIGIASLQRYEGGALPTEAHANLVKRIEDPLFLRQRLADSDAIGRDERQKIAAVLDSRSTPQQESASIANAVLTMMPQAPSVYTGGRSFDSRRFREVLVFFANNATDLFRTKLNKVLFYLDFSAFRDTGVGITGLRYAHADFGPVPDKYEPLVAVYVDGGALSFEERAEGGQVLRASREADLSVFSPDERARLRQVAEFANSFPTATALTSASHEEDAWLNTSSGSLISYELASSLRGM